jgi:hypothetical protein
MFGETHATANTATELLMLLLLLLLGRRAEERVSEVRRGVFHI